MKTRITFLLTSIILLGLSPVFAQPSIKGAWKAAEYLTKGPNDSDFKSHKVQPGLVIFMDKHYSIALVNGEEPRPLMPEGTNRSSITEEQMRSIFMSYTSNSGTYEVSGNTLSYKPMVALWPNFMEGGAASVNFMVEGDVLYFHGSNSSGDWKAKYMRVE